MATKSSQNRIQNRVPKKWRDLPAAGHGITPAMKARPIIERTPNEDRESNQEDYICDLMPVSMVTFMAEHTAMQMRGYHAADTNFCESECRVCGCDKMTFTCYAKRHRNGKPDYDWVREFNMCPQCLHVQEEIWVMSEEAMAGLDPAS